MEKFPTHMLVVAAALQNSGGLWLMQCRPAHKHHGGLWEFPGGKVEDEEIPSLALSRELREELDLGVDPAELRLIASAQSAGVSQQKPIVILLYTARKWAGEPRSLEGGSFAWFTPAEIDGLDKPPLDIALAEQLLRR